MSLQIWCHHPCSILREAEPMDSQNFLGLERTLKLHWKWTGTPPTLSRASSSSVGDADVQGWVWNAAGFPAWMDRQTDPGPPYQQ